MLWYDMIWYMIYDMIRYDTIRYDMIYDMIWYDICYDLWYDMIRYLFTVIGFPPGGSGRLPGIKVVNRQLYTKGETIHKTIQQYRNAEYTK